MSASDICSRFNSEPRISAFPSCRNRRLQSRRRYHLLYRWQHLSCPQDLKAAPQFTHADPVDYLGAAVARILLIKLNWGAMERQIRCGRPVSAALSRLVNSKPWFTWQTSNRSWETQLSLMDRVHKHRGVLILNLFQYPTLLEYSLLQ